MAEELHAFAGRQVLTLLLARRLYVDELGPESHVERVGSERAGVEWTGDKFPEWFEILKYGLAGIVVVSCGVVHVGCEPDGIAYTRALDERQDVGDLKLASTRRSVVALRDRFNTPFAVDVVDDQKTDRHIGRNDFPSCTRIRQLLLEPGDLCRAEKISGRTITVFFALAIGTAVAAHVEHEHVEQGAIGDLAIDTTRLALRRAKRHVLVESSRSSSREQQSVLLDVFLALVLGARERLSRPPVIGNLVIVPLGEHRNPGVEREHVLVEQVVFVVAAKFGQRFRRL